MSEEKHRRRLILGLAATNILVGSALSLGTTYTWASPTASGTWQNAANWNPNTGTPSLATDAALLNDATADRVVSYINSAVTTVNVGTLSITETSGNLNELDFQQLSGGTLAFASNVSLSGGAQILMNPIAAASGTGTVSLAIPTLTLGISGGIASAGVLEMTAYEPGASRNVVSLFAGNLNINNGGILYSDNSPVQVVGDALNNTITGQVTMGTGGTISLGIHSAPASSNAKLATGTNPSTADRLSFLNNVTITGGSLLSNNAGQVFQFTNTATTISGLTNSTITAGVSIFSTTSGNSTQSFLCDSELAGGVQFRAGSTNSTVTFGAATASSLTVDAGFKYQNTKASGTQRIILASDISSSTTITQSGNSTSVADTLDLNGHTFAVTAASVQGTPTTGAGSFTVANSSANAGTLSAAGFTFNPASGAFVASNVNLVATGGSGFGSNLSAGATVAGTINAASTFVYAGTSGAGTLTATGRTIGNLAVSSGTLQLNSSISNAGTSTVSIAAGGTLNLNGNNLTTAGALTVGGTLISGTGTPVVTATGGVNVAGTIAPGTVGTVGTLSLASSPLTLSSASKTSFDLFTATSGTNATYGGTLAVAFGYVPTAGDSYQIFQGFTSLGGNFNITNANGYTLDFNSSTGFLTVDAVPEPASLAMLTIAPLILMRRRKRC